MGNWQPEIPEQPGSVFNKLTLHDPTIQSKTSTWSAAKIKHVILMSYNLEPVIWWHDAGQQITGFKDVRAHCYCASLVRTQFIGHARATSFSSVPTNSKTQQNIERTTFALTWCANIFVGCSVTPTFFFGRSLPFLTLFIILKNKKNCVWEVLIISHILFK